MLASFMLVVNFYREWLKLNEGYAICSDTRGAQNVTKVGGDAKIVCNASRTEQCVEPVSLITSDRCVPLVIVHSAAQ